jgi:hypothetical protein
MRNLELTREAIVNHGAETYLLQVRVMRPKSWISLLIDSRVFRPEVLVSDSTLMIAMEKTSHLRSHGCILRNCRRSDDLPPWRWVGTIE